MKLGIAILYVENVSESRDFYVNKLGFHLVDFLSSDTFATLVTDPNEQRPLIALQDIKTAKLGDKRSFKTGSSELGFIVDDVDFTWEKYKSNGVDCQEITNESFGRVFYINAPEGHIISFYQLKEK